jgi:hypothetical protein
MNERYYADDRDLVKWSAVLHAAKEARICEVFYVAMYTHDSRNAPWVRIRCGATTFDVHGCVWQHFRSPDDVKRLSRTAGIKLRMITERFSAQSRDTYFDNAASWIGSFKGRKLVLVDPDTGVSEQGSRASRTHVTTQDLSVLWARLQPRDVLLVYQHTWRDRDWIDRAAARLQRIVGSRVRTYRADSGIRDAVLLAATRR